MSDFWLEEKFRTGSRSAGGTNPQSPSWVDPITETLNYATGQTPIEKLHEADKRARYNALADSAPLLPLPKLLESLPLDFKCT